MLNQASANAEKRHAALSSVFWSLLLTVLKLGAGLATNSLGLLSEALHSALDLVAAGITYFAVRLSAKPPDRNHTYGYGKMENLSALIETLLLLLTCIWIVYEALDRLFFSAPEVRHSWWGIGVLVVAMGVDLSRARMLKRVAEKHNSQALEADALHFSTDVLSSSVVLVGLLALWGASFLEPGPVRDLLERADALAALTVSGIVIWVGLRLAKRAIHVLLDGGSLDFLEKFEQALAAQLPLYPVRNLRVRQSGAAMFADLTLSAPTSLTLEESHRIAALVESIAKGIQAEADIIVQIKPAAKNGNNLLFTVRAMATAHGLSVHNLVLEHQPDGARVYLHVETPGGMSLREAHDRVEAFENTLRQQAKVEHVISHIEPDEWYNPSRNDHGMPSPLTETDLREAVAASPEFPELRDIEIRFIHGLLTVSLRCCVSGDLNVGKAHDLTTAMERRLRSAFPVIDRVNIHIEPECAPSIV